MLLGLQPGGGGRGRGTYGQCLPGWSPISDVVNKKMHTSKTFCSYKFHDNR